MVLDDAKMVEAEAHIGGAHLERRAAEVLYEPAATARVGLDRLRALPAQREVATQLVLDDAHGRLRRLRPPGRRTGRPRGQRRLRRRQRKLLPTRPRGRDLHTPRRLRRARLRTPRRRREDCRAAASFKVRHAISNRPPNLPKLLPLPLTTARHRPPFWWLGCCAEGRHTRASPPLRVQRGVVSRALTNPISAPPTPCSSICHRPFLMTGATELW